MIKFFRHIRKSFIEQNKMGKYFKYAFGEILLVMIGILLALQVNNWNEGRKTKLKAKSYAQTIFNDLVSDTISINALTKRTKTYSRNINYYFNYLDSLSPSNSNKEKLWDSIQKISYGYVKYFPINNSFKQMETSGNGKLLHKKQRDFLLDLLAEQDELDIIITSQLETAINHYDKSNEFLGIPASIYQKLKFNNPEERQVQALVYKNLHLKATDDLYGYIEARGARIKKMIVENINLFSENQ